ncbi:hypothetical protein C8R45DRAFT_1170414 [Mycena sanguinolenta]|nr:hypothetical protein C8R45DRAFT_1170414 [Mycena sanguinolenta]
MVHTVGTRSAATASDSPAPEDSSKRKLDSESDAGPSKPLKNVSHCFVKHSRFWMLDGNAILQFGSIAFKLHRSRLSAQSVWFEKLFDRRAGRDEPLEADEKNICDVLVESLDGIDVFYLDMLATLKDFEALLGAMDDAIGFSYDPPLFAEVAAIFRAATTFKFQKFKEYAQQYLLDLFSNDALKLDTTTVPHPAAAVVLGRDWNLPGILLRAFYELLRTQPAQTINRNDDEILEPEYLPGWDVADVIRLGETHKQVMTMWLTVLSPSPPGLCPAKTPCPATTQNAGLTTIAQVLQNYPLDPLCGLDALVAVDWESNHRFCQSCAQKRKKSFTFLKIKLWNRMRVWLEIPAREGDE